MLHVKGILPLLISANGRGRRQMCLMDKFGFPRTQPKQAKRVKGFATGDMVKAVLTTGKKSGTYVGRVAVRSSGSFNITTRQGTVQGISHRTCSVLQRCDGYSYGKGDRPSQAARNGTPLSSPCLEGQGYPEAQVG